VTDRDSDDSKEQPEERAEYNGTNGEFG